MAMSKKRKEPYFGEIDIVCEREEGDTSLLKPWNIQIKLDGKPIPYLQKAIIDVDVDEYPVVTLVMVPKKLRVKLDGITVIEKEG